MSRDAEALRSALRRIDGKGYGAYKDIKGEWTPGDYRFVVDWVQGDPYAAPSRVRIRVDADVAALDPVLLSSSSRRIGVAALLCRTFGERAKELPSRKGSGRSGEIRIEAPVQEVWEQTALRVDEDGAIEARFGVGLPARGRRILASAAETLLLELLPALVRTALLAEAHDPETLRRHATVNEDADALRDQLEEHDLVAFVADDAHLPRRTGIDERPLAEADTVPFRSPESLRLTLERPNAGSVSGMGVKRGVTLIVGGGYHGKSTVLRAIEHGVHNHRPGDGREYVVTDPTAVRIRAEDGRAVTGVDISTFIGELPGGRDTTRFDTPNASGSTSQAAAIMEAVEAGTRAFLVDEDTAATNFMIRDRRMQSLVPKEGEPITPFVDRIRQLYEEWGISSVLVLGGSGDYLETADTVVGMRDFRAHDLTDRAREVAAELPTGRAPERPGTLKWPAPRVPRPDTVSLRKGRRPLYMKVRDTGTLVLGREVVDISAVEPVVSWAQANTLGRALLLVLDELVDGKRSVEEILEAVDERLSAEGLDVLDDRETGDLVRIRRFELTAALNRIRSLEILP